MLIGLFDANAMIPVASDGRSPDPGALLELMDQVGIAQAMAYYEAAAKGDTRDNNRLLLEAIRDEPRLVPCWVMDPCVLHPTPADIVREAVNAGVTAMRWFVQRYDIPLDDPLIDLWMTRLERAGIALMLDWESSDWHEAVVDWPALLALAREHPGLPIILVGRGIGDTQDLYQAWEAVRSIHVETSAYQTTNGIADACRRFGPDRLMFGSGLPCVEPQCAIHMLRKALIDEPTQKLVAGDTLRRVLAIEPPGGELAPPALDPPYKIVDMHGHIGAPLDVHSGAPGVEQVLEMLDALSVEWMGVSSVDALQGNDLLSAHEALAEAADRFPDRLRAWAAFYPSGDNPADELYRCLDGFEMQGIVLDADLAQRPYTDKVWHGAFQVAAERYMPVLARGAFPLELVKELLETYETMTLILSHGPASRAFDPGALLALAARRSNLYLATDGAQADRGALTKLVHDHGAERIVFASSAGYLDPAYQLGRVLGAQMDDDDRRRILRDNALELFGERYD